MKHILLLGATGNTGCILTKLALDAGLFVTVLVRNPADLCINNEQLEIVQGDVLNYQDVEKVVQGQDAVLSTLGRDGRKTEVLTLGTRNIITAMINEKVHRFIGMSSIGSGSTKDKTGFIFPLKLMLMGLKESFKAKAEQEQLLYQSHLNFSLIQAGTLTNEKKDSLLNIKTLLPEQIKRQPFLGPGKISRQQVAAFMLNELIHPSWIGKTICIYN